MGKIALAAAILVAGCSAERNAGEEAPETATPETETVVAGEEDALVPGTEYHATTTIDCATDGGEPVAQCDAGVIRNWGDEPGGALVEVTRSDGTKRAIFFRGTEAYGADSAQADGSTVHAFSVVRNGDQSTISFGPERYVVPDALITGG